MKTDFRRWASAPPAWVTSTGPDVGGPVLSSRVRLARNLAGSPFPHNATAAAQRKVVQQTTGAFDKNILGPYFALRMGDLSSVERSFLVERQLISHEHAQPRGERGLFVSSGEATSIMVNEEDHLRAARFVPGLALSHAWETLSRLDDQIAERLPIAFGDYGFVTACPTNLGTGLRASCLIHLPALVLTGKVTALIESISQVGLVARGFYGEGTQAIGDLFQVSNGPALARSEVQVVRQVEKAARDIVTLEKREQASLFAGSRRRMAEDRSYRALGTLKSARLLQFAEAMQLVSLVRLGALQKLDFGIAIEQVTDLFFLVQSAHIRMMFGCNEPQEIDIARSDFVRKRIGK